MKEIKTKQLTIAAPIIELSIPAKYKNNTNKVAADKNIQNKKGLKE
jgi:hypothetical protein